MVVQSFMLSYSQLKSRPRVLRSLTGLSSAAFGTLCDRFASRWSEAEGRRLGRRGRRRAIGAGRRYKLERDADKLLLFLMICRHGLTYELAGFLFGIHTSNARKLFIRLAPVVEAAADPELADFLTEAQKQRAAGGAVGSWEALLEVCPELAEVAVDSSEHQRQRPGRKRQRKKYYSGKAGRFTLKTAIVVSPAPKRRILHVSGCHPGPTHDKRLYEQERLEELIPKETRQFLDLGYQGLEASCPEHDLRLPYKRPSPGRGGRGQKGPPLSRGQKQANALRRRRRVVVEHALGAIRGFRLMLDTWRSRVERHNPVFRAVAALTNLRCAA